MLAMAAMFARTFFFQENRTSCRSVLMTVKRSCLVLPTNHKKKCGKSRISAGEIPKLFRHDLVANPIKSSKSYAKTTENVASQAIKLNCQLNFQAQMNRATKCQLTHDEPYTVEPHGRTGQNLH